MIQCEIVPWLTLKAAAAACWFGNSVVRYSAKFMCESNTIRNCPRQTGYYIPSVTGNFPYDYASAMGWKRWGERLRTHMRGAGVTQEAVAAVLEVSQGTIAHWLSGRREINLNDFFRLCEAAGAIPSIMLFGDSEELAVVANLQKFLTDNPALQQMIAKPAVPPIIAAAALPPAPKSKARRRARRTERR